VLEVLPFAAIRYDFARFGGDLSAVIAPPYDVLDEADKAALLARSDRNIVAIDLPHVPPKSMGPQAVYDQAAATLAAWLAEGTLVREAAPAMYVYHQTFEHAGRQYTRRKFIARVRLRAFAEGVVLPHEQTFGGPKEDRLALMKATRCNLSPIFGLYRDPEDRVGQAFAGVTDRQPEATATLDGVVNRLWVVKHASVHAAIGSFLRDRKLYIADGHHRYGTSLLYRESVAAPAGSPADHVMFVLASMDDPGCLILPYHRAVAGVDAATIAAAWGPGVAPAGGDRPDIVLYDGRSRESTPLRFTRREALRGLAPEQVPAWHELDVAYLHRYLLDGLLADKLGHAPKLHFLKSEADARKAAEGDGGTALLLNATPMAHLQAVSDAGGLMPQKSTYFHPKLATGLTLNPLA
jgi:uncharacterized protein (DUF1015 family)